MSELYVLDLPGLLLLWEESYRHVQRQLHDKVSGRLPSIGQWPGDPADQATVRVLYSPALAFLLPDFLERSAETVTELRRDTEGHPLVLAVPVWPLSKVVRNRIESVLGTTYGATGYLYYDGCHSASLLHRSPLATQVTGDPDTRVTVLSRRFNPGEHPQVQWRQVPDLQGALKLLKGRTA